MFYYWKYQTPSLFDDMIMTSDGEYLTGLFFLNSKDSKKYQCDLEEGSLPIFLETKKWLDCYFDGKNPDFVPKYKLENVTSFRQEVSDFMKQISYGETVTYADISNEVARKRGCTHMSCQAVGGAVGWNPICIIIPCHRVVGSNGKLTGYGGGMKNKIALLALEGNDMTKFK